MLPWRGLETSPGWVEVRVTLSLEDGPDARLCPFQAGELSQALGGGAWTQLLLPQKENLNTHNKRITSILVRLSTPWALFPLTLPPSLSRGQVGGSEPGNGLPRSAVTGGGGWI